MDPALLSASDIHTLLEGEPALAGVRLPSLPTVERLLRALRPREPSVPWHFGHPATDADDDAVLLPIEVAAVEMSRGQLAGITLAEARWALRISRVAHDLGAPIVWLLSRYFVLSGVEWGARHRDLEMFVAFAPWRGNAERERYMRAIDAGWIGGPQGRAVDPHDRVADRVWIESDGRASLTFRARLPEGNINASTPTNAARARVPSLMVKRG